MTIPMIDDATVERCAKAIVTRIGAAHTYPAAMDLIWDQAKDYARAVLSALPPASGERLVALEQAIWDAALDAAAKKANAWHHIYGKNVRDWVELDRMIRDAKPMTERAEGERG